LCKTSFPAEATYVCDRCLGPLEPVYDYDAIRLTHAEIASRPKNLWRYRELLPITGEPKTGFHSGFTPLVRCDRLADRLGIRELYIKDDSVNHPTLSYKDRVVSVAATRAVELGLDVLACASTGNLANSVAAHAARLGLECCVFIPDNLEAGKVMGSAIFGPTILAIAGNYDDVNRLCTQVADRLGWGFVNINLRSYYAEGAKTSASKSSSNSDGAIRTTSSRRSPAERCCHGSGAGCGNSNASVWSRANCRGSTRRRRPGARPS
jgi:threonine synthase